MIVPWLIGLDVCLEILQLGLQTSHEDGSANELSLGTGHRYKEKTNYNYSQIQFP